MSNNINPQTNRNQPVVYEIKVEGQLGREWADWFGGLTVVLAENGDTLITGPIIDQAALHGLLKKVRDLGIPLLSVNRVVACPEPTRGADQADEPDVEP